MTSSSAPQDHGRTHALEKWLWALILLGGGAVFALNRPWLTEDSPKYLELARRLGEGSYATLIGGVLTPQTVRPPGYAIFLALVTGCGRLPYQVGVAWNFALYIGGLLLVFRLLKQHGQPGWVFLMLAAAYPFTAAYCSFIMTEALALFMVCAIASLLARPALPSRPSLVAAGLLCGALALVRADMILLVVLLPLAVAHRFRHEGLRQSQGAERAGGARAGLAVGALGLLVLLPYASWNARHFGRFVPLPVAGAVGHSLFMASWANIVSDEDLYMATGARYSPQATALGFTAAVERANREIGAPPRTAPSDPSHYGDPATQLRSSRVLLRAAVEHIRSRPAPYALHVAQNLWLLWNTSRYPPRVPPAAQAMLRLVSGLAFVVGMGATLWFFFSRGAPPAFKLLALLILYTPLVHIWLHTEARYTAGARPLLLFFASIAVAKALPRLQPRREMAG